MELEQLYLADGLGMGTPIVTGVMALTGIFTGWLGYRIRYRGDVHLIAGYGDSVSADTEALSRVVGSVVLVVAAVTVLAGLTYPVLGMSPAGEATYWSAYTTIVCVLSLYAVVAGRRSVDVS